MSRWYGVVLDKRDGLYHRRLGSDSYIELDGRLSRYSVKSPFIQQAQRQSADGVLYAFHRNFKAFLDFVEQYPEGCYAYSCEGYRILDKDLADVAERRGKK